MLANSGGWGGELGEQSGWLKSGMLPESRVPPVFSGAEPERNVSSGRSVLPGRERESWGGGGHYNDGREISDQEVPSALPGSPSSTLCFFFSRDSFCCQYFSFTSLDLSSFDCWCFVLCCVVLGCGEDQVGCVTTPHSSVQRFIKAM